MADQKSSMEVIMSSESDDAKELVAAMLRVKAHSATRVVGVNRRRAPPAPALLRPPP